MTKVKFQYLCQVQICPRESLYYQSITLFRGAVIMIQKERRKRTIRNWDKILNNRILILIVLLSSILTSCMSRKHVDYFQEKDGSTQNAIQLPATFEPLIIPNDLLEIRVSSINPEAARFFNPGSTENTTSDPSMITYLVDAKGEIELPLVGKVLVSGNSTRQIRELLRERLEKYLQSPTVMVTLASYKITILGEVKVPGLYQVKSEKINITEALGLAGDLNIFGDRKKVMIIREKDGIKSFYNVDLTSRDIFSQPYYFLHPGDVIYVPSGKGRIASADAFYRIAPIVISSLTLISLLFYRFN
jgi:polysaccharide export outer membrane protein